MNIHIRKMYLIHDWLYSHRSTAEKYNDGKDSIKESYIIVTNENDAVAEEIPAEEYMIYSSLQDVIPELRETLNDKIKNRNKGNFF
ncbi:hypothetical protein [Bacillus atrophaeus]|uniref:hypothetical protein n=1 Tax=Bacillus atrophaeus TaxID=1452 RepID=UPI002282C88B|nr:hypothetical protein [Bacillus atrophaeus]MCY8478074.1 hypothetical protein [Bacillus atrophaeus]